MSLPEIESAIESLDENDYEQMLIWLEGHKLARLRQAVAIAIEEADRGERIEARPAIEKILARIDRRIAEQEHASSS